MDPTTQDDTQICLAIARGHYENFPVASRFLPRALRLPVAVIYAFARTADDFADEGSLDDQQRIARLEAYGRDLDTALGGQPVDHPVLRASARIIHRHRLPAILFHDLLTAFRMDVTKKRYATFAEVLHYCRYSANPVGRLMLHLSGAASARNLEWSDQICSSLQLINFLQDLAQDYDELGRIYIPCSEMDEFQVTEAHFRDQLTDRAMADLVAHQVQRARNLMLRGSPLGGQLRGLFGYEIRMIIQAGLTILNALRKQQDVFARPRLTRGDKLAVLWRAIL